MRTLLRTFALVVTVTFALLATDVLDLCRVAPDGAVEWAPSLRTDAIARWVRSAIGAGRDAVSQPAPAETQSAAAR